MDCNIPIRHRPKRFEAMWLSDNECNDVVIKAWCMNVPSSNAFMLVKKVQNVNEPSSVMEQYTFW